MKKLLVAILCLCIPAIAHHSMAGFDRSQALTLEGVVKNFAWQNPHAWIELEVTKDGKVTTWNFEMTAPAYLVRAGWKKTSVKPGDKITVVGNPLKTGEPGALFVSVTLADGTKLGQQGGGGAGKAAAK
ncbi:MAG: DUF6152 family protein [Bryobacteraceae bacterium]